MSYFQNLVWQRFLDKNSLYTYDIFTGPEDGLVVALLITQQNKFY